VINVHPIVILVQVIHNAQNANTAFTFKKELQALHIQAPITPLTPLTPLTIAPIEFLLKT